MNGLIILLSAVLVAYTVLKTDKLKKARYVLAPLFGLIYGFILLYVGMSINSILFYVLATLPLIVCVIRLFRVE